MSVKLKEGDKEGIKYILLMDFDLLQYPTSKINSAMPEHFVIIFAL